MLAGKCRPPVPIFRHLPTRPSALRRFPLDPSYTPAHHAHAAAMSGDQQHQKTDARLRSEADRLAVLLEITNLMVAQRDLLALFEALSQSLAKTLKHEFVAVALFSGPRAAVVRLAVVDGSRFPALEN